MLTRNIGIVLIVFSVIIVGFTVATLVFLTSVKGNIHSNANIYLSLTSVVLVLALLTLALSVLLVIPESRWTRTLPVEPLDL